MLAWATFFTCIGPTRAQTAADAVSVLCPKRAAIAPAIEAAAARWRVDAVVLTALVFVESSCNPAKQNKRTGCYGLAQIKLDGSANPDHLEAAELLEPTTNAELGARHLRRLINVCGSLGVALSQYHSRKRCPGVDAQARRVLGLVELARATLRRLREARS